MMSLQVDREAVSLKPLVDEVVTLLKVLARDGVQLTNEVSEWVTLLPVY
jgi:hypothetical protein